MARHRGRMQVKVLKEHVDHGGGLSTRVMKVGHRRSTSVVVVTVVT